MHSHFLFFLDKKQILQRGKLLIERDVVMAERKEVADKDTITKIL